VNHQPNQDNRETIADGDAKSWRAFLQEQIPRLYGMFIKSWSNPSLAEELVQQTVFDAVRGLATYDAAKGSCEEWLFGIARNNIRLEIRRRAARPTVDGDISTYLDVIDSELLPDEVLERKETADIVRAAFGRLDVNEQAVLKAKYIEDLSARQIAAQIGITEKGVHSLLYRARESLRAELKRTAPRNNEEQKK